MIRKKPFLRSVSYLLLLTMTNYIAYPTALAMSFDEATKAGSNSAQSSAGNFVMPSTDGSSSYTFDGIDEPISMGDIFRGVDSLDVDDLKKMADSDSSILNKGVDSQKDLNASESDDPYKQAYDTTKEIFFKKTPDMTNDPMWGKRMTHLAVLMKLLTNLQIAQLSKLLLRVALKSLMYLTISSVTG